LDTEALEQVKKQVNSVKALYPDIKYSIEIVDKIKGTLGVKAPHYLVFGSEEKEGAYENIGFIGQQLDLYFSEAGLGSCWLGMAKSGTNEASKLPHVICMSFGKPDEPLHREISEFKRKSMQEISEGSDERLEAARLAPSAMNGQNWFFVASGGKIHCYRKKPSPLTGFIFNKLGCIDMGIAICHIAMESTDFCFGKEPDAPSRRGYAYMGTVK